MPEIQVLIDTVEQGYMVQRDAWETGAPLGTVVTLMNDGTIEFMFPGPQRRRLRFERSELEAAIELLERAKT